MNLISASKLQFRSCQHVVTVINCTTLSSAVQSDYRRNVNVVCHNSSNEVRDQGIELSTPREH